MVILTAAASACALMAAYFVLIGQIYERQSFANDDEASRRLFRRRQRLRAHAILYGTWTRVPRNTVLWLKRVATQRPSDDHLFALSTGIGCLFFLFFVAFGLTAAISLVNLSDGIQARFGDLPGTLVPALAATWVLLVQAARMSDHTTRQAGLNVVASLYQQCAVTAYLFLAMSVASAAEVSRAAVSYAAVTLPITFIMTMRYASHRPRQASLVWSVVVAAALSTAFTPLSILLGSTLYPDLPAPQTAWIGISNFVADIATVWATIQLLQWGVRPIGDDWLESVRLLIAICGDIVVAAALACISLSVGLLSVPGETVTVPQAIKVLFGWSVDGSRWEFGPYFWLMHTTFLPTTLYLCAIVAATTLRLAAWPVGRAFGEAATKNDAAKMLSLTAKVWFRGFSFLALAFGSIAGWTAAFGGD